MYEHADIHQYQYYYLLCTLCDGSLGRTERSPVSSPVRRTSVVVLGGLLYSLVSRLNSELSVIQKLTVWERFILDKVGRRKLFIFGNLGMGSCMLISGLTIMAGGRNNGIAAVVMLYMFQVRFADNDICQGLRSNVSFKAFFTWGWMSNMWSYPSEILPLRIRQRGSALSVVWQWLITFLVVEITPVGIANIGWKLYVVFCILNWASIFVVWFYYPETAGKTLESIDFLFASQTSLRQVVKLSKRKDIDVAHEMQRQVHQQKVEGGKTEHEEGTTVEIDSKA